MALLNHSPGHGEHRRTAGTWLDDGQGSICGKDIPTWPSVTEIEANVETLVDGYLVVSEEEPESVKIKLAVVKPVAVRLVVAHGHPGSAERHEKRPSVT
jgi:hypothetical protein